MEATAPESVSPHHLGRRLAGRSRSPRWEALAWVLAWCAARAALVASLCDVFGYGEELEKACAGKALLDGVPVDARVLAYHPYEGGGFVVSHLDALAFALLGESVLSVKLVAIAFGAAILLAGWWLVERFAGRAGARAFAALYVFAPESVQANSLLALGIHYQSALFVALIAALALRIALERDERPRSWLVLGLASGFGFYFSYSCALTILVAGAALIAAMGRKVLRRVPWAVAGALLGAAPLLGMAARFGRGVLDVHGAGLVADLSKKPELLGRFVESIFAGRPAWDSFRVVVFAAAPVVAAFAIRAIRERRARFAATFVALHAVLFLAAYLLGGFTVGTVHHYFYLHRLTPLWFLGALLVAIAFGGSTGVWRSGLRSLVLVVAFFGAGDAFRLARDASPGRFAEQWDRLASTKGYRYPQYLQKIAPRLEGSRTEKLGALLHFDERDPGLLHEALAISLYGSGEGSFEQAAAEIRAAGVADPTGFYRGLGLMLLRHHVGRVGDSAEARADFAARIAMVEGFPPEIRDPLIESIGRYADWDFMTEDELAPLVGRATAAGLPISFFIGLGRLYHDAVGDRRIPHYFARRKAPPSLDVERALAEIRSLPANAGPVERGYRAALEQNDLSPAPTD